jgi:hypothetical protein
MTIFRWALATELNMNNGARLHGLALVTLWLAFAGCSVAAARPPGGESGAPGAGDSGGSHSNPGAGAFGAVVAQAGVGVAPTGAS